MAFDGVTVAVILIILVILVSTLVQAVFGFGNAQKCGQFSLKRYPCASKDRGM